MSLTDSTRNSAVRSALRSYMFFSVIALVVVATAAVLLSSTLARHQAERDAQRTARAVAMGVVAPLTTPGFRERDPDAMALMTKTMELRTLDGSIKHVKIWGDAGNGNATILWASEKPLVGRTFPLEPEEYAVFGTDDVISRVSGLDKAENELERAEDDNLVEVYAGLPAVAGQNLLFEAYTPTTALADNTRALAMEIAPLPLGALALFLLLTLPLAVSLARRVDNGQMQMRRLLVTAVASSDHERRRIAQDLHDGVLQDIAGVGYALASDARQLDEDSEVRGHLDQASTILQADVSSLRHLMDDIHPPDVEARGLAQAVRDVVSTQDFAHADVTIDVDDRLAASPLTSRIALRIVRELLRNVSKHAHASNVVVRLHQVRRTLHVEVADDGVGFDPTVDGPEGHFGLRLIQQTVADAEGRMRIDSAPGQGTRITAELPA
jgi:signal transduction histidine kinase